MLSLLFLGALAFQAVVYAEDDNTFALVCITYCLLYIFIPTRAFDKFFWSLAV